MLQQLSSQLANMEKDSTVNTLKKCVEDLSCFIRELKSISTQNVVSKNTHYSVEDMRNELSIQISEVVRNINSIFESLKTEFSIFSSLNEVRSLRCDINNGDSTHKETTCELKIDQRIGMNEIRSWFKRFVLSYKSVFNLREVLWLGLIIVLIVKLIFCIQ